MPNKLPKSTCAVCCLTVLSGLSALLACLPVVARTAGAPDTGDPASPLLQARVEELREYGELELRGARISSLTVLPALYEGNGFRRIWDDGRADQLMRAIRLAEIDGLNPRDYHLATLELLESKRAGDGAAPLTLLAHRDLILTDAFVRLWSHVRYGKLEARVDSVPPLPRWDLRRQTGGRDPTDVMREQLAAGPIDSVIAAVKPQHRLYRGLCEALIAHRALAATGGWPRFPAGRRLGPGACDGRVPLLRRRLAVTGEWRGPAATDDDSVTYDDSLQAAVRAFQRRHGLGEDAVVGARTQAALNVPVEGRIAQIRANLERARWLLQDPGEATIFVNVPDQSAWFELARDTVDVAWSSRVQVGRPLRRTPTFSAQMTYLVFNPTWIVPEIILARDIIPEMRRDPASLERRHLRLYDAEGAEISPEAVDWSRASARRFPYQVRMGPDAENPLGRVKFMLPNRHQIYLHDTPRRALFARRLRAASSGCIRLEDPLRLAELLLEGQTMPPPSPAAATDEGSAQAARLRSGPPTEPGLWNRAAIDSVISTGETLTVPLRLRPQVLILYLTAWQDGDGRTQFRDDLYSRDAAVIEALEARFGEGE